MKNTVLVVWMCWWVGFCLCHQPTFIQRQPNLPSSEWISPQHGLPSSSNTPVVPKMSRFSRHPVPGVNEDTHTMNTTDNTQDEDSSTRRTLSYLPSPNMSNINHKHNTDKNLNNDVSAMNNSNNERPERNPHSDHESHRGSSLPEGRPESHGRVITTANELCSYCLCNIPKKNVVCEHEHTTYDEIHELTLDHLVIPRSAETLRITGFESVYIRNNTFDRQDLKLRVIEFENIPHLELETNSLHFSEKAEQNMEVVVVLTNCNIKEMPQQTFTQMTYSDDPRKDVNLEETRFMTLKIHGCNITTMRSYALHHARLLYFEMTNTKVEVMEENCIHVDSYKKWKIERSRLPNMVHKSVSLRAQDVVVFSHNTFMGLANRSLDILSASQVLFEFNELHHLQSEALLGIRPYDNERAAGIVFLNNTIIKADEASLMTSKKYPMHEHKIITNKFNIICDCNIISTFNKLMNNDDLRTFEADIHTSFCLKIPNTDLYTQVKVYVDENCTLPITIIVAGSAVGVILLILVIVCVVCTRMVRKAREEANYLGECCVSQSFSTLQSSSRFCPTEQQPLPSEPSSPLQPWVMAVPEVKTYKETELNVAYENTEPMKCTLREGFHPEPPGPLLRFQCKAEMRSSCPFN